MPKGMDSLKKAQEQAREASGSKLFQNQLRLGGDARVARIRFLSDVDDFFWAWFHPVPSTSRLGKKFTRLMYCTHQDGEDCQYCAKTGEDVSSVKRRLFFWVYVYDILHNKRKNDEWEGIEYLGDKYWKEPVNAPRILETGPGFNGTIENKFIHWAKRFKGTISDRDYEWTRTGDSFHDTSYDLVPIEDSKSELSDEQQEVKGKLKPLEEIIIEERKPKAESEEEGSSEDEDSTKSMDEQLSDIFMEDE